MLLLALFLGIAAATPVIQVFDGTQSTGRSVILSEDAPYLDIYGLNDEISSFCMNNSLWILYENEDFNSVPGFTYIQGVYNLACEQEVPAEFDNKVSSIRYAGSPTDILINALTIFSRTHYGGEKAIFEIEAPRVELQAGSFIVSGRSSWTIYPRHDFEGEPVCLFSSDPADAWPGFYPEPEDASFSGPIGSLRRGCWSDVKAVPVKLDNHGTFKF